jgi:hypothetical protein
MAFPYINSLFCMCIFSNEMKGYLISKTIDLISQWIMTRKVTFHLVCAPQPVIFDGLIS